MTAVTNPEILAQKAKEREERKREAEKEFLSELKETIWEFIEKTGRITPPAASKKRASKTARAFWEWIFPLDGPVTAEHVRAAFEFWEKTGNDWFFRVESKVYSGKTNWVLTKSGVPYFNKILEPPPVAKPIGPSLIQRLKKSCIK